MEVSRLAASIRRFAQLSHARSGGPGGQHVNKTSTKIVLTLPVGKLEGLNESEAARLRVQLANRINHEDELVVHSSEDRSQKKNIEESFLRAEKLIISAARLPKHRKPSRPSKAVKEKRLASKRLHGLKKAQRNYSAED